MLTYFVFLGLMIFVMIGSGEEREKFVCAQTRSSIQLVAHPRG